MRRVAPIVAIEILILPAETAGLQVEQHLVASFACHWVA
jgi:hypothetical protein